MEKNELGPLPHSVTQINSQYITDLNVRAKSINVLE